MDRTLGDLEKTLLYALVAGGPESSGLALRKEVRRRTGRDLSPGGVYTALGRLENRGLVCSEIASGPKARRGRPARLYTITPVGAELLAEVERVMRAMAEGLSDPLEALTRRRPV